MKKKKILILITSLNTGGTTSSLKSLIQTSLSKENDISILVLSKNGIKQNLELGKYIMLPDMFTLLWFANISTLSLWLKILVIPLKILKNIPYVGNWMNDAIAKRVARQMDKKYKFDAVIAYSEFLTPLIVQYFKDTNKIAWIHCDYGCSVKRDEEHVFKNFNTIVCVSNFTKESFVRRYPLLKEKVVSIYNVCSIDHIKEKSMEIINDKNFDTSKFTIISVGRIASVKRFTVIPIIANKLKRNGCEFKWYIIGNGDSDETEKIKIAIKENKVDEEVILLGRKTNPYPYFKAADLLVSTSESEACPMIFNEAKILGLPIVSTDFGSSYEFIEEGRDGYINSIENIHNTIADVIINKNKYDGLIPQIMNDIKEESIINKINIILKNI